MNLLKVSTWFRAATQRLRAARVLFDESLYIDASYLGGYVSECAIKGYLLSYVPLQRRKRFIEENFRRAKAHDFAYLRWLALSTGVPLPTRIVERVRAISWSTDLRYSVGLGDRDETVEIIEIGDEVLTWAQNNT